MQKPSSSGPDRKPGNNKASKLPALNVITNFSKPPILAQRAGAADQEYTKRQVYKEDGRKGDHNVVEGFIGLSDIQASKGVDTRDWGTPNGKNLPKKAGSMRNRGGNEGLNDRVRADPAQYAAALGLRALDESLHRRQLSEKYRRSPHHHLGLAGNKVTELSPDGSIAIGISVPSDRLAEFAISPETATVERKSVDVPHSGSDREPPATPNIVVTPAKDEALWSAASDEDRRPARRRAASSVYSQATPYGRGVSQFANAPPVPARLPEAYSSFDKERVSRENTRSTRNINRAQDKGHDNETSHSRVISTCTVFDEDDSSPSATRKRTYSGESQLRILNRSSVDTVATRHRSQGWWNTIVSPFLSRHNTIVARNSPAEDKAKPELPSLSQAAAKAKDSRSTDEERSSIDSSPLTPEMKAPPSGRASIWTEMSHWEAERGTIGLALDHTPKGSVKGVSNIQTMNAATEPAVNDQAQGLAAEYFEACRHDQNSPTPYFECQRHTCRPSNGALPDSDSSSDNMEAMGGNSISISDDPHRGSDGVVKDTFFQTPSNRFSAAFAEATKTKPRANSECTDIEEDSIDATPEVQEARVAPIVRAGSPVPAAQTTRPVSRDGPTTGTVASPQASEPSVRGPPPYSPPRADKPMKRYVAVMPPDHPTTFSEQPQSASPVTPGLRRAVASQAARAGAEVPKENAPQPMQNAYTVNYYYGRPDTSEQSPSNEPVTLADLEPPPKTKHGGEEKREIREKSKEKAPTKKESRVRKGCLSLVKRCFDTKKKRRNCGITASLVAMIILVLALALTLTRKGNSMPVQTQWLNITGYPPIPTGIATIAQPDAVDEVSGCVQPATMWSCSLPKEQQASIAPSAPDQPNFRIEILFQNGTVNNTTATAPNATDINKRQAHTLDPVSAGSFIRRRILALRDALIDFTPSPSAPSQDDQIFLGNTTDNNTEPFDGEATPFYITFLPTTTVSSTSPLSKRQDQNSTNTADPFPDIASAIPSPSVNPNGTAASANLLPFPSSQPLRLYNRDSPTEHYGFYNYFDRSIFLKSIAPANSSDPDGGEVPDDENGGSTEDEATVRCTWAQTRFLVQIWTNQGTSSALLPSTNSSSPTSSSSSHTSANATISSANDFSRPGSFPYPVTVTLDRHGGDVETKMIYCYGMDDREMIVASEKSIHLEDRSFGGTLVNPAQGPFGNVTVTGADGSAGWEGGIDGGTGGCSCQWRNWEGSS